MLNIENILPGPLDLRAVSAGALIDALDVGAIEDRLQEIEGERQSLIVLLRSKRSRARPRPEVHANAQ